MSTMIDLNLLHPHQQTEVFGKWILVGEHAVLRGCPAILFPVKSKNLMLKYWETDEALHADFAGEFGDEMQLIFWSVIERAINILEMDHAQLHGRFFLENNIPVGAGMGASAAVCVAIGRWFMMNHFISSQELHEFARQLENLFHGESSGADIAVAIAGTGIYFTRLGELREIDSQQMSFRRGAKRGSRQECTKKYMTATSEFCNKAENSLAKSIQPQWSPHWCLSFSDKVSTTARCVKKVKTLWEQNLALAQQIDADMVHSVHLAEKALQNSQTEGLSILQESIELAGSCFKRWGLTEGSVDRHIQELREAGAIAAKPTGSGDGGFVISLWASEPPKDLGFSLLAV